MASNEGEAEVITDFGRPNEKRERLTLRLAEDSEVVEIGRVRFRVDGTNGQ